MPHPTSDLKPADLARFVSALPEEAKVILVVQSGRQNRAWWTKNVEEEPAENENPSWPHAVYAGIGDALKP